VYNKRRIATEDVVMDNESMATITIRDIPDAVHKELRIQCIREGVSMNQKVVQLLTRYIEEVKGEEKK